jgi:DNA recombination protein RmuC
VLLSFWGTIMQADPAPPPQGPATDAGVNALAPLIDGPVEMLWLLVLSILFIMALAFVLLLRGRAASRARLRKSETEFFKPAGDGAEITFDDTTTSATAVEDTPAAPKKSRGAFAGLFAQRDKKPAIDPGATPVIEPDAFPADDGLATVKIERGAAFAERDAADAINARLAEEEAEREAQMRAAETERRLREAEMRQRDAADRERRDREAQLLQEEDRRRRDAELWQARRAEEDARRAADLVPARFAAEPQPRFAAEDYSRTLSEVEEAMSVQREAIQSETRALLDAFGQRLSARLDMIAEAVERAPASAGGAPSAALAEIARDMAIVRDRLDRAAAVDPAALQQELSLLRQAITGQRDTASPAVQLADVIRNALPPDAYQMPANLSNSRRADCLIKLPRPSGPIAIDARFPVEAFNILRTSSAARASEAENEFRRVAIRHVVDVAERMISPGETADSAILFLPSEAMYTELQQRFPDVVQDAWRARVWIVSPTTLLATLHTIQAAIAAAEPRAGGAFLRSEDPRVAGEMTDLKRRIAALEDALARAQPAAPAPLYEPAPVMRAPAPPPARAAYQMSAVGRGVLGPTPRVNAGDVKGDLRPEPVKAPASDAQPARPLFPLR